MDKKKTKYTRASYWPSVDKKLGDVSNEDIRKLAERLHAEVEKEVSELTRAWREVTGQQPLPQHRGD
jgi:hypothetical protein